MRMLVALGGNALLPRGVPPDAAVQLAHIEPVASVLADLAREHQVVITHGNGPQVGMLAIESAADLQLDRPYPLDALVAETQGMIGYWLQRSIADAGLLTPVVTVVTQTLVDHDDPALRLPTKFVGPLYGEAVARRIAHERGWTIGPDGSGWRRTVASPTPRRVIEADTIRHLVERGVTVVCAGGGGCPVTSHNGRLHGVEAVVDKDLVAASLAIELDADLLVLATDVPGIYLDFGTSGAQLLREVSTDTVAETPLAAGSMGPKADAACRFVDETGRVAVIGAIDDLRELVAGGSGTRVHRGGDHHRRNRPADLVSWPAPPIQ